jgi:hypothetical protein
MSENNQDIESSGTAEIKITATPENAKKIKEKFQDAQMVLEANRKLIEDKEKLERVLDSALSENFETKRTEIADKLGIDKNVIQPENFRNYKLRADEYDVLPKPAPRGSFPDTAPLNPSDNNYQRTTYKIDDNSDVPIDMLSFDSTEQAIEELERRKKNGCRESAKILNQMTKNFFKENAVWEYNGKSSLNLIKDPLPINDSDSAEIKTAKRKQNAEILRDKLSWTQVE